MDAPSVSKKFDHRGIKESVGHVTSLGPGFCEWKGICPSWPVACLVHLLAPSLPPATGELSTLPTVLPTWTGAKTWSGLTLKFLGFDLSPRKDRDKVACTGRGP